MSDTTTHTNNSVPEQIHDTSGLRHDVLQKIFPTSWASEYPGKPRLSRRERRIREQRRIIARKVAEVFDADTNRRMNSRLTAKAWGNVAGAIFSDAAKRSQADADAAMASLAAAREQEAAGRRDTLASPEPVLHDVLVSALTEVLEKVVVTTQGRTFKADGAHIMTFTGHKMPSVEKVLGDAARLSQSRTQAQPLTHDDVRAIVSEEIGKVGGLLLEPVLDSDEAPLKFKNRVHGEGSDGALDDLIWSPVVDNLEESIAEFVRDRQLGRDDLVSQPVGGTHNSSPSVDGAGAHSVGDGPGAGDASATPATEVTEDSLHTRLTFIQIDEGKAEEIYLAAQANLADAAENLAHARNKTRDAETAYTDFVNGDAK
ncbi:hypothetical protein [Rhodococcus sp. IEGM 1318]|uniref:hypothetical protein n=1 Tax=Rhodococcus sp. IEGM 1318 TaxID=3082226 RepID=UPI0029531F7B|nr:hypothetical protein [Rhodococcus sp. IEGM 1318]MDV8005009.1 hypothetical protein [Rhodococcus sp. IEGM 1318]